MLCEYLTRSPLGPGGPAAPGSPFCPASPGAPLAPGVPISTESADAPYSAYRPTYDPVLFVNVNSLRGFTASVTWMRTKRRDSTFSPGGPAGPISPTLP